MNKIKTIASLFLMYTAISLNAHGQQVNPAVSSLSAKQAAIVPIAAYAAKGDQMNLKNALAKGLDAGLAINEVKEILVQLYAYAGFPRSLNAISTFQRLTDERRKGGVTDAEGAKPSKINFGPQKYAFGKEVQAKLTGMPANSTQGFVPVIDTFLKEHLFADIFGRNNLDYQSREIATISILASLGGVEGQLRGHLNVGRNVGLTELQLRSIVAGLPAEIYREAINSATQLIDNMFSAGAASASATPVQTIISEPTFAKGSKVSGGNFTGEVWVNMLTSVDTASSTSVGNVTFAPKARSNWHLHPSGQILLVTDGVGYYQEKGKSIRVIRKGDVIKCAVNVAHWHGASPESSMSHIALGPNNGTGVVVWMGKVTDEEYNKF
ncbi:carboxymuconolactone decarboxylase family protein [Mucilaginibacter sp.]